MPAPDTRPRGAWLRLAWRFALLVAAVLLVEYGAGRLLGAARHSWEAVRTANLWLLGIATIAEVASWCCYSAITYRLLPRSSRPRYPTVLAIDLAGNGFAHVVPGGGATAVALRTRLQGRAGVPGGIALATGALESAVAALWLVVALMLGLIAAVPYPATHPFLKTACAVAAVIVVAAGGVVAVLAARPDEVVTFARRVTARTPALRGRLERLLRALIGQVERLVTSPDARRAALGWGLGNWLLDAIALFCCLLALGHTANVGGLLTTYALVCLIALLPVTPGGLGLVEGVAVPVLISFGTPHGVALVGVLAWRLLEFWMTIPVGAAAYVALRLADRHRV